MIDLVGVLGWIVAALLIGLWWGERGRRRASERYLISGSPDTSAPKAVSMAPAAEAEDRFLRASQEAEEATVKRVADGIMEEAKAQGIHIDAKKAKADARSMVAGEDVLG